MLFSTFLYGYYNLFRNLVQNVTFKIAKYFLHNKAVWVQLVPNGILEQDRTDISIVKVT